MYLGGVVLLGTILSLSSVANEIVGVDPQSISDLGGNLEIFEGEVVLSLPEKIKFDFDSDALSNKPSPAVLAGFLVSSSVPLLLTIEGHTDEVGSDQYNHELSKSRAESLKDELIKFGVDGQYVIILPRSKSMPIDESGKKSVINRRLELTISYR
jgi:outer membrane protein OmpA-like peptidoglycan-associated protein